MKYNLQVNNDKTEYLTLKRGNRDTERWRTAIKLGSHLGDTEDIARRKELATTAMRSMHKIWLNKYKVNLRTRIKLFNALVKSILLYNCSCWGLRKADEDNLNGFHRQLLRRMCRIFWPCTISNKKLYKLTRTQPLTLDITRARWRYFGHALRASNETPQKKAMLWFFKHEKNHKKSSGRRTTIVSTIQRDIRQTLENFPQFQIKRLAILEDYVEICNIAADRMTWRRIVKTVTDSAKAKLSLLSHTQ